MSTIVTRVGKGAPLTHTEMDTNFTNLNTDKSETTHVHSGSALIPASVAATGTVTGSNLSGTNTGDQTITLTGDVTGSGSGSFAATIANNAVTLAKMADIATASFLGRNTAATGDPEVLSTATAKTMLNLTGTNSGDQTISLTGDVTGSGSSSFAATIANAAVTYAKMQNASVGYTIMAKPGTGAGAYAELAAGTDGVLRRSGAGDIAFGSLVTNNIGNSQITYAKLQNASAGFTIMAKAATGAGAYAELAAGTDSILMRSGSGNLTFGTIVTNQIGANQVTLAKTQMNTARLIGRTTAAAGAMEEITVGSGLTLSAGSLTGTGGTVTAVSVASANGFAGSSSGGTTPALTLSTSITGVLKGNGTALSAATAGTDYSAGTSALTTGILKSTTTTGALSIAVAGDFPTLNQNTTGQAGSVANSLTPSTGLSGSAYNGSAAQSWTVAYGSTGTTACVGNDSRLSDARTPLSHSHGNIGNGGAIGVTANLPIITTTSGVLTVGSFGTGANTFCQGNDGRLSDARPASDVYAWAKTVSKPTYTAAEVGAPSGSGSSTGTNTGDQTITLSSDVTGSGSSSITATIAGKFLRHNAETSGLIRFETFAPTTEGSNGDIWFKV